MINVVWADYNCMLNQQHIVLFRNFYQLFRGGKK